MRLRRLETRCNVSRGRRLSLHVDDNGRAESKIHIFRRAHRLSSRRIGAAWRPPKCLPRDPPRNRVVHGLLAFRTHPTAPGPGRQAARSRHLRRCQGSLTAGYEQKPRAALCTRLETW
jgi:hypothetical protein